jgi:F-type H+-transporting ATPase subunit gamma
VASTQLLKRRIRSVKNTKQITKAMELVAAAKMRRVQEAAARSRIYSDATISILRRLTGSVEAQHNIYFAPPSSKGKLYIIFNSDSGLAGAYNANIINAAHKAFTEDRQKGLQPAVIVFGRKGARHFSRLAGINFLAEYENIPDNPDINVFAGVLETIKNGVNGGNFSNVTLIYTESISTMVQRVRLLQLIPVQEQAPETVEKENERQITYEFEPDAESVLQSALSLYFESSIHRARVEAAASEHAMRMMAMNNANRNAGDLIDNLTLELNATRQAAITQEMAEIIGGANAIA